MKRIFTFIILLIIGLTGFSQNVGINATGATPNTNAGLDVDFPNKGVLIPRVALTGTANFAPLAAHVAGMVVYNTATAGDVTPGFYYNNGTNWVPGLFKGNSAGNMIYWNGTAWVMIPAGVSGQILQLGAGNVPSWATVTAPGNYATLTTNAATAITGITATSGGNITADGGSAVLSRGICYNTATAPTTANLIVVATPATGTGIFSCNLAGLLPVTTYFVRAYATNNAVTSYGNEISFTTLPVLPTVTTTAASSIAGTTATSGGNVTATGGASIIERGIVYSKTLNPTIPGGANPGTKITDPAPGLGTFASNITGLTGATLYHVRSYATNSVGIAYGADVTFTTLVIPPTLTTVAASNIGYSTATSGGTVTFNGGGYQNQQAYGIAYATTPNAASPTRAVTNSANAPYPTAINPFATAMTGLAPNTTYYIRSFLDLYLISPAGWVTVYGPETSFTTTTIQTTATGVVTQTTAVSGGTIATGVTVNARGVCWSTNPAPTIGNSFTSDGITTGTYVSNISGLTNATLYYVRAYYTDGANNTFYGNEYSFTTGPAKAIGDALAGGKVIYVDATGQHGLIGALVDQGTAVQWGCYGIVTNATGSAIYTGLANTNLIVAACGAGTAAKLCADYTAGGQGLAGITNWYLPSKDEIQYLIAQKTLVGLTTSCGVNGCMYWTSTEYNSSIAYLIPSILVSPNYNNYKNTTNYVRAVRAF